MANIKSIDEIEKDLIEASAAIGRIHESNGHYTYGLARIIWEMGKPVEEMTVKELLIIERQYHAAYNELHKGVTA